jgi:hypothetical protein
VVLSSAARSLPSSAAGAMPLPPTVGAPAVGTVGTHEHQLGFGWRSIAMVGAMSVAHDGAVLGTRRQPKRERVTAAPGRTEATRRAAGSLAPATERLTRAAAAVRRAAGAQPPDAELSVALEHLEQTLDDLSQGMARMSHAIGEEDTASGGLAWRLETLRHALQAARHVCSHARSVVPRSGADRGGSMLEADEPSVA